ncbi:hypothetical protein TASIC1_0008043800 [Trichoderma asperellum]|uniref:Uncharacterized protein n=1 Tax=Trichoderma asperellum TaxID=101201 RepID=A0A6V8QY51_TRIAP|nr:hypothetical protein TASIC1_0008043800 [Trichoderma asperellum]
MVAIANILLLAATVATASVLRRDATPLVNTITNQIAPQIATLQNDINGFPASGLNGTIQLESDEDTLSALLDTAAILAQEAGSFSLLDGLNVISAMAPVTTQITAFNLDLDAKKADFKAIGKEQFVLTDLQILSIRWKAFTEALVAAAPLSLVAAFQATQTTILESYAISIAVYSDAA